jgi:hypothetical protein
MGQQWVIGAITIIWNNVLNIWEQRNHTKHGVDGIAREAALISLAQRASGALYKWRNEVQSCDQNMFYANKAEYFEKDPSSTG